MVGGENRKVRKLSTSPPQPSPPAKSAGGEGVAQSF